MAITEIIAGNKILTKKSSNFVGRFIWTKFKATRNKNYEKEIGLLSLSPADAPERKKERCPKRWRRESCSH
jgi:hypothetical protein